VSVNGLRNIAIDMTVIFLYCMTKMLIMHMTNFYEDSLYSSCFCSFIYFFPEICMTIHMFSPSSERVVIA
jgi:hypothetical protein